MIDQALQLHSAVTSYMISNEAQPIKHFILDFSEWCQLEYVCDLLCPFYAMTAFISEMRGPSVHKVFDVYESLFEHLEGSIETLQRKQISWKERLCSGLHQAHRKLRLYYSKTYQDEGYLYAIATILNPAAKLEKFTTASWIDDGTNWIEVYQQVFSQVFEYYKQKHSKISVEAVHTTQCTKLDHA